MEIAVLHAWELDFGEVSPHIFEFVDILGGPKKSSCCFAFSFLLEIVVLPAWKLDVP